MDTVLLVLGVLGFGAVVIAAYVFTVAARNYVSENDSAGKTDAVASANRAFTERSQSDRRQLLQFDFPMTVNGILISAERRVMADRRLAAA